MCCFADAIDCFERCLTFCPEHAEALARRAAAQRALRAATPALPARLACERGLRKELLIQKEWCLAQGHASRKERRACACAVAWSISTYQCTADSTNQFRLYLTSLV
ncbi:unnamed protein product [Symbiodinium sp. CCMP2456]|nr:unnamed protein product [Symbiodinium sp. CCMP2456]